MRRFLKYGLPVIFILATMIGVRTASAQSEIYVIKISGPIDNGMSSYVKRNMDAAAKNHVSGIIFNINTYGGLVQAADEIRQVVLDSKIPTVAFINKNAASAGSLIALAADSIFMAPGSSMGAATVVSGSTGEKASAKMQSYMASLMRTTAETRGRNPKVAEAMVDAGVAIEGVSKPGQPLALTAREAVRLGMADGITTSVNDVKDAMGWRDFKMFNVFNSWKEHVLRIISNPIISIILMLLMIGGIFAEVHSPGLGVPGGIAAVAALLFFAPLYVMGLAQSWEILLFFVGVVLIILEVFVIPGFGVTGIAGILLLVFSLGAALVGNIGLTFPTGGEMIRAIWTMAATLVLSILLIVSLVRYLPSNQRFKRLVLMTSSDKGAVLMPATHTPELVGKEGTAVTPLRPGGLVSINGDNIEVVSRSGYIDKGTKVKVTAVHGKTVEVENSDNEV